MLDIGVGGGRTSYTFARLVKNYVGIDYSASLIEHCKKTLGETDSVKFLVADARNMSALGDRHGLIHTTFKRPSDPFTNISFQNCCI